MGPQSHEIFTFHILLIHKAEGNVTQYCHCACISPVLCHRRSGVEFSNSITILMLKTFWILEESESLIFRLELLSV